MTVSFWSSQTIKMSKSNHKKTISTVIVGIPVDLRILW